jgi:uncharacterized RDD family membrane protein YckC
VDLLNLTLIPAKPMVFAGLWDRVMAKLIDGSLLALCLLPVDVLFRTSLVVERDGHERSMAEAIVVFLVFCLYSAALECSKRQGTLGKMAVGILVSDSDGNRISFGRSLLRAATQFTVFGYLLAVFTERKQAFHDLMAETQVIPGTL